MLKIGTVVDNVDPEGRRRVRITTIDRGVSSSQWIPRLTNFDGDDLPVPIIGSSVVVAEISGDSIDDVVLGVLQSATTNSPIDDKPDRESWWSVLVEIGFWVTRKFTVRSPSPNQPKISLDWDGSIFAENRFGSIRLLPTGYLTITNPDGTITFGASGWVFNSNQPINIQSPSLTWNGQTLAVVGGVDTDGDVTIS